MDLRSGGRGDRAGTRCSIPQGPRRPAAQGTGLDAANPGDQGRAAGRGRHRALVDRALAPAEKKARQERRTLVFVDESGFYLLPGVVKTYGPKGRTPILHEWQTRDHLSVMCGVTPEGKLYTLVRSVSLNSLHSVTFLEHLRRLTGGKLLVIWDGSPIHRGGVVKEFLAEGGSKWVHLEAMPYYAPDLNPGEWLWQHLKHVELRNLCCMDLDELHSELDWAIARVRQKPQLLRSFFGDAGLKL